jgi:hypothetical protein
MIVLARLLAEESLLASFLLDCLLAIARAGRCVFVSRGSRPSCPSGADGDAAAQRDRSTARTTRSSRPSSGSAAECDPEAKNDVLLASLNLLTKITRGREGAAARCGGSGRISVLMEHADPSFSDTLRARPSKCSANRIQLRLQLFLVNVLESWIAQYDSRTAD